MDSTATTPASASDRLRAATAHLHDAAEQSPFQRTLAKGRLSIESYAANLGQLLLMHRALDARLGDLRAGNEAIGRVVEDEHLQSGLLEADLRHFKVDLDSIEPIVAVSEFIQQIETAAAESPIRVLGMLYVVEGANNGSHYFVTNIRRSYALTPGEGDQYLDPYGDQQRVVWARFKANLDDAVTDDDQIQDLIAGAEQMYGAIIGIGDALGARFGIERTPD